MSTPTSKAAAERRGYLRALRHVETEVERFQEALSTMLDAGGVEETPRLLGVRKALGRVRFDVLTRLRDAQQDRDDLR